MDTIIDKIELYYHFGYSGIIISSILIFFCIIILYKSRKSYKQKRIWNKESWSKLVKSMDEYYLLQGKIDQIKFYTKRFIYIVFFLWFLSWVYFEEYYLYYLEYIDKIYAGVVLLEYFIYVYVISQTLYKQYFSPNNKSTCILIAFGGSNLKDKLPTLSKVLSNAVRLTNTNSVFLLHNGKSMKPILFEDIKKLCDEKGAKYIYTPVPNKSYAIYYATKYICSDFEQCLIIDDDVILPNNLYIPTLIDEDCAAYMIKAEYHNLLTHLQSLEYGMSGLVKVIQSRWYSALSHHGAIGLWKRDKLIKVMLEHDAMFHGEDLMMGVLAHKFKYRMIVIENKFIPTETPKTIKELYRQRTQSWDYVVLKFIRIYLSILFSKNATIILRWFVLNELWTIFIDLQRFPLLIYIGYNQPIRAGVFIFLMYIIQVNLNLWFNYVTVDKPIASILAVFLLPGYKFILTIFRFIGEIKYFFKYNSARQRIPIKIRYMPELQKVDLNNVDWNSVWI
jgi:hypothetical protein